MSESIPKPITGEDDGDAAAAGDEKEAPPPPSLSPPINFEGRKSEGETMAAAVLEVDDASGVADPPFALLPVSAVKKEKTFFLL